MKARDHYNLTSNKVYKLTIEIVSRLPLIAESVRAEIVANVLVFAAAFRISVHESCGILKGVPSSPTILNELAAQNDDLESLEIKINRHFVKLIPKGLGRRGRTVAIDLVKTPYHGTVEPEQKEEVVRTKAEHGTSHFFVYATAYAVVRGRRYTLALYRVRAGEKMEEVVKKLLRRLRQISFKVSLLLIDRGFYSVAVIRYLIAICQRFIMPAVVRGKKETAESPATGTRALAALKSSCWHSYTLKNGAGEEVSFEMAVVCRNYNGRYKKQGRETLLYVTWGLRHKPLTWIKETYRNRFGIESSYRQLHQARIRTSTRNPILRLLFVAIALLLRNFWVWLHSEVIALPRRGARTLLPSALRFQTMLLWLLFEVAAQFQLLRQIVVPHDIDNIASDFSLFFNY
jgi:putative transposase